MRQIGISLISFAGQRRIYAQTFEVGVQIKGRFTNRPYTVIVEVAILLSRWVHASP